MNASNLLVELFVEELPPKALKKLGWKFVGPTTVYAFMQSVGMVNDHSPGCHCHAASERARLAQLRARGVVATPAPLKTDLAGKADAVSAYASQLRGLGGLPDAGAQAESYWRVAGGEEPRA